MMLRWKNMRTLVLLAAVLLGMSSFFIYLNVAGTPSEAGKASFSPYAGPIPGQEVSFDQAKASVPFKINLPTKMGTFVQIKLLRPPQTLPGMETLYVIYAAHKPSSDSTVDDVVNQDGIILVENPNLMTLENSILNIRAAIGSTKDDPGGGLQEVSINGYVGCAGGNLDVHEVSWYTKTTEYHLIANINYPLQQLVEIAQSIPVK